MIIHLNHEDIYNVRDLAYQVRSRSEVEILKAHNQIMDKRNTWEVVAILELKEREKILRYQLYLIDEKHMEIHMKLDWTRSQTEITINNKDEEVRQLFTKFSLLSEFLSRVEKKVKTFSLNST